jgi:hypothetical protein
MARSLAECGADRSPASGRRCFPPPRSACWGARERLIRRGGPLLQSQVKDSLDAAGPQTAGPARKRQRRITRPLGQRNPAARRIVLWSRPVSRDVDRKGGRRNPLEQKRVLCPKPTAQQPPPAPDECNSSEKRPGEPAQPDRTGTHDLSGIRRRAPWRRTKPANRLVGRNVDCVPIPVVSGCSRRERTWRGGHSFSTAQVVALAVHRFGRSRRPVPTDVRARRAASAGPIST